MPNTLPKTLHRLHDAPVDWDDLSTMKALTCVHHPSALYTTKNPWQRSLHLITPPSEADMKPGERRTATRECECPFDDLRVVITYVTGPAPAVPADDRWTGWV
jgi:hypothetical protein